MMLQPYRGMAGVAVVGLSNNVLVRLSSSSEELPLGQPLIKKSFHKYILFWDHSKA